MYIYIYGTVYFVSGHPRKIWKKWVPNLPANSFKTIFSSRHPRFLTSESNAIFKILKFPLSFAPKALWSVPNKPNPSFSSIFHAKKSIQISSGLASPYWNATTIPPVSHPSLLAFYTPNMSHLNMGHLHPSHISLRYSQSLYKTHILHFWNHPCL